MFLKLILFQFISRILSTSYQSAQIYRPRNGSIEIGGQISFNCSVDTLENPIVVWMKKIKEEARVLFYGELNHEANKKNSYRPIRGVNISGGMLVIDNVSLEDDGEYMCSIQSYEGSFSAFLDVLVSSGPSNITSNLSSEATEGDLIQLNCSSTGGNPPPQLVWAKNDLLLNSGRLVLPETKFGTTSSFLEWKISREDHLANFSCFDFKSTRGSEIARTMLFVRYAPIISMTRQKWSVIENSSFSIDCMVSSYPSATISWHNNGAIIGTDATYHFKKVTRRDAGNYTCIARNFAENQALIQLDVLYGPNIELTLNLVEETYKSHSNLIYQQETNGKGMMVQIKEDSDVEVSCSCDANPPVEAENIRWTKDGVVIQRGKFLKLKRVRPSGSGLYSCEGSNQMMPSIGSMKSFSSTKDFKLTVLYKPGKSLITMPSVALVGQQSILHCSSSQTGFPSAEYTWSRDSLDIYRGDQLIFPVTVLSHSGFYTCTAINIVGAGDNDTKEFSVQEIPQSLADRPGQPEFVEVRADQNEIVQLKCSVRGKPAPTIQWLKNGLNITNDLEQLYVIQTINQSIDVFSFNVTSILFFLGTKRYSREIKIKPSDAGNFSCLANNHNSPVKIMHTIIFSVKFVPELTAQLVQSLELFRVGKLTCTINSYPKPNVQWMNGTEALKLTNASKCNLSLHEVESNTYVSTLQLHNVQEWDLQNFTIVATNECGRSQLTVMASAAVLPEAPQSLTVISTTWGTVDLMWKSGYNGGLSQHFLIYAIPFDFRLKNLTLLTNESKITFTGLQPNNSYIFKLFSENSIGRSDSSNEVIARLPNLRINSPKLVKFDKKDMCLLLVLQKPIFTVDGGFSGSPSDDDSEAFCARVNVFDGMFWVVEQSCTKELNISLKNIETRVSDIKVAICSEKRSDICSKEVYALPVSNEVLSNITTIIIGSACSSVVLILLITLIVLCNKKKQQNRRHKSVKSIVTLPVVQDYRAHPQNGSAIQKSASFYLREKESTPNDWCNTKSSPCLHYPVYGTMTVRDQNILERHLYHTNDHNLDNTSYNTDNSHSQAIPENSPSTSSLIRHCSIHNPSVSCASPFQNGSTFKRSLDAAGSTGKRIIHEVIV